MNEDVDTMFTFQWVRRVGRRRMEVGGKEDTIEVVFYQMPDALGL